MSIVISQSFFLLIAMELSLKNDKKSLSFPGCRYEFLALGIIDQGDA
jgi:hypothetical protein